MSLDIITSKILDEANSYSDKILEEATKDAENMIADAKKMAKGIVDKRIEEGKLEQEKIIERGKALINVEKRKMVLAKKQEILKEVFNEAGVSYEDNKRELLTLVSKELF